MAEDKIYSSVLEYMCENYNYSLYATDFGSQPVSSLQRSIASISSPANETRMIATKMALQDFFNAIFQKVFVYEDEERLKIVKYFDEGAINEQEDKQIHSLRQELVEFKDEVENTFCDNSLYMFDKNSRRRFEITLLSLKKIPIKSILREQIGLVFDLDERDMVIFLNGKVFLKKFKYQNGEDEVIEESKEVFYDRRFVESLWEEVKDNLNKSYENGFDFFGYEAKVFYTKYPLKLFSIIESVVKNTFVQTKEQEIKQYSNIVFKSYLPKMLREIVKYIFEEVMDGNLKAIKFLKSYSESTRILNFRLKLDKAPLMDSEGNIYKYQNILAILKEKELLNSKITHKNIEIKNLQKRVQKSIHIVTRSEDEMESIQKRRLELLLAIKKVEDELRKILDKKEVQKIDINRLEFSKRDLLEAFKQVEVRSHTQTNILKNTHIELKKWEEKKTEKTLLKETLKVENAKVMKKYTIACDILAIALGKEPIEF